MRYWTAFTDGKEWWEGDADLRIQGNSESLTFTILSAAPQIPAPIRLIGQKTVFSFSDWKDDGTTALFTFKSSRGQVYSFRLLHQANGRFTGTMEAPEMTIQGGLLPGMKGSLDLMRAP